MREPQATLRVLLAQAASLVGGPQQPVLLARLGNVLQILEPGFTPSRYGARGLADLLAGEPDLGQLRYRPDGHPEFVFAAGVAADARAPADGGEESEGWLRLKPQVWRAVTDFNPPPGGWCFDLERMRPAQGNDPEREREPERFLRLPQIGVEQQRALFEAFVHEHHPDRIEALMELSRADGWLRDAPQWFIDNGAAWRAARIRGVIEAVLGWADAHGIPRDSLAEPTPPAVRMRDRGNDSSPVTSHGTVLNGEGDPDRTRRALHALIDGLDDHEVLRFPVPAWALPGPNSVRRR